MRLPGGAYLAALSSRLNKTCSNRIAVEPQHRQIGRDDDFDPMPGQHAAGAFQRGTDDLGDIHQIELQLDRAGFEAGHVEQIADEAVEALGLVLQGGEQLVAIALVILVGVAAQARHGAEDRGERRSQIMRDRGQERGAQPLGFGQHAGLGQAARQRDALDRDRCLIGERIEQTALVRGQQRTRRIAVDADHADRPAPGAQRQKQPFAAGQRVGTAAGGWLCSQHQRAAAISASSS